MLIKFSIKTVFSFFKSNLFHNNKLKSKKPSIKRLGIIYGDKMKKNTFYQIFLYEV